MIDGKAVAAAARERVAGEVEELAGEIGRAPGLATVLVGDDPASAIYVRNKRKFAEEVGIALGPPRAGRRRSRRTTSWTLVRDLNADDEVDGILVQLPLPDALDAERGRRTRSIRPRTWTA